MAKAAQDAQVPEPAVVAPPVPNDADPLRTAAAELAQALIGQQDPGALTEMLLEVARGMQQPAEQADTGSTFDGMAQALTNLMGGWQPEEETAQDTGAPSGGAGGATEGSSGRASGGGGTPAPPAPAQAGPTAPR